MDAARSLARLIGAESNGFVGAVVGVCWSAERLALVCTSIEPAIGRAVQVAFGSSGARAATRKLALPVGSDSAEIALAPHLANDDADCSRSHSSSLLRLIIFLPDESLFGATESTGRLSLQLVACCCCGEQASERASGSKQNCVMSMPLASERSIELVYGRWYEPAGEQYASNISESNNILSNVRRPTSGLYRTHTHTHKPCSSPVELNWTRLDETEPNCNELNRSNPIGSDARLS